MDKVDHIYKLHHLLSRRRTAVSRSDITRELECSIPTVYRTIGTMRDHLRAPIEFDKENDGYGLYMAHGFVSSFLAKQTSFSSGDLDLLWQALAQMFEHDRSAARGEMSTRGLFVFKHDSELGNAPAHALFDRVRPKLKDGLSVPRTFEDYEVAVNDANMPTGVTLTRICG